MRIVKCGAIATGKLYRFACPYCKTDLEAEEAELTDTGWMHKSGQLKFICPVCKCNRYIDRTKLVQV